VRIRIINAGSDTAFRVALGEHQMTVTHSDGFPVAPVKTYAVMVAMGERYDVTSLLFFTLGLMFSIPLLRRLHRRFHTWRAPAIAVVVFADLFSISAFVIGPAIAGNWAPAGDPTSPTPAPTENHSGHRGG